MPALERLCRIQLGMARNTIADGGGFESDLMMALGETTYECVIYGPSPVKAAAYLILCCKPDAYSFCGESGMVEAEEGERLGMAEIPKSERRIDALVQFGRARTGEKMTNVFTIDRVNRKLDLWDKTSDRIAMGLPSEW